MGERQVLSRVDMGTRKGNGKIREKTHFLLLADLYFYIVLVNFNCQPDII